MASGAAIDTQKCGMSLYVHTYVYLYKILQQVDIIVVVEAKPLRHLRQNLNLRTGFAMSDFFLLDL